jgi:hypothetical protein
MRWRVGASVGLIALVSGCQDLGKFGALQQASTSYCDGASLASNVASPQIVGTSVIFTGSDTSGCTTPEYRFWVYDPYAGSWSIVQDWSTNAQYNWNTSALGVGTYGIELDLRQQGATNPQSQVNISYALQPGPGCSTVTLVSNQANPVLVGTSITYTATATCDSGFTPEYRFYLNDSTGTWVLQQDWSASNTWVWDTSLPGPNGEPPGWYEIKVQSRKQGGTDPDGEVEFNDGLGNGPGQHLTNIASNGASTVVLNPTAIPADNATTTTVTVTLLDQQGAPQQGETIVLSVSNSVGVTITQPAAATDANGQATGTIKSSQAASIRVIAKAFYNDVTLAQQPTLTVGGGGACTAVSFSETPASPQQVGTQVTINATPTCSNGATPEYRYWINDAALGWFILQDWSQSASANWDTTNMQPNFHTIQVDIRTLGDTNPTDTVQQTYQLVPKGLCTAVSFNENPVSPTTVGTTVVITATPTCSGGAVPEYRFTVLDAALGSVLIQDWSQSATANWNTSNMQPNTHTLTVDIRTVGDTNPRDTQSQYYILNQRPLCTNVSFSENPASPATVGTVVQITATPTCGMGATAEYRFSVLDAAVGDVLIQDWSQSATASWDTSTMQPNTHTITVDIRTVGDTLPRDSQAQYYILDQAPKFTCTSVSFSTSPANFTTVGTPVQITATPTCDAGATPQYRYWVQDGSWSVLQDWTTAATVTWATTGLTAGTKTIAVDIRAQGESIEDDEVTAYYILQ